MSVLADVSGLLTKHRIDHALIGAAALAIHGVARATADLDLLATDRACLRDSLWDALRSRDLQVEVRVGDESDPLAGVVRITAKAERSVDVVIGKHSWQRGIVRRGSPVAIGDVELRAASAPDLVLLKLYAGGPQDAWDIDQLLEADASLICEVEGRLDTLPPECASLWQRIVRQRTPE